MVEAEKNPTNQKNQNRLWFFAFLAVQIILTLIIIAAVILIVQLKTSSSDNNDDINESIYDQELGATYTLIGTTRSWKLAESRCAAMDAHLVSIGSEKENQLITRMVKWNDTFCRTWIGLNNINNNEKYTWSDGKELTYINWFNNTEPTIGAGEFCVFMASKCQKADYGYPRGSWFDTDCQIEEEYTPAYIICKKVE